MSETLDARISAVYVKNVSKQNDKNTYDGSDLKDISFSFEKKGVHCILAPKGSGKTELMDILSGSSSVDSGEIAVFERSPYGNSEAKAKIGYLRQDNSLYENMTAVELMSFVGEVRRVEQGKLYRQIKEALELVGLDDSKNKLISNLTEYDRKKLSLASALLGNPDILLLDEPITARMSSERKEELLSIIAMLGRIKTVVVTTDSLTIARELCEDVVILSDGRVLAEGAFETIDRRLADSENPTTLETLYGSLSLGNVGE